jgi:hypothetical protein
MATGNGLNLVDAPLQGQDRKVPLWLENALSYLLGLDGVFHVFEMCLAIYEEAYLTATVLGVFATLMFMASWILGEKHTHK